MDKDKEIKELVKKSEDLNKKLNKNKGLTTKRGEYLADLEENVTLLDESAVKYKNEAQLLEEHFQSKWRRYLIAMGCIAGALLTYGLSGFIFKSKDNSNNYSNDY